MKTHLYSRLAMQGMKKNKKLYVPYIITCIGAVMMFYILKYLSVCPLLSAMKGGRSLGTVLTLGQFVIAVFSVIFLFYTNSFLIRRRYKEFGLYNVLGMDKKKISRIVVLESVYTAVIAIVSGTVLGVLLSYAAQWGLMKAVREEVPVSFSVSFSAILSTVMIYAAIFLLICVKSLIQVKRSKPVELMQSEKAGEKPPKSNIVLAVIGVLILGAAYYIAVSIKNPLSAFIAFFVAVILVIIATYILFIAGSVSLCSLLKKNKRYYYKKEHFVSVSSMAYRMKRNGAGLASICILATMVLVMISSTSSLFFGAEDSLKNSFPRECEIDVMINDYDDFTADTADTLKTSYQKVFDEYSVTPKTLFDYRYASVAGLLTDNKADTDPDNSNTIDFSLVRNFCFVNMEDYNRLMNENLSLNNGECAVCPVRCSFDHDTLFIDGSRFNISQKLDKCFTISEVNAMPTASVIIVVTDFDEIEAIAKDTDDLGYNRMNMRCYYGYDTGLNDDDMISLHESITDSLNDVPMFRNGYGYSSSCIAQGRYDFLSSYGGLFFIAIVLSVLFICAAAMIIYYKQISEGYEDSMRYSIMRKVGMTKKDIRKSVNSQILTVFFAPLIFAGIHLAFAFPMIWKLLQLFELYNFKFVIFVTLIAFALFAGLYAIIYAITAKGYYAIVSKDSDV